ncbi:HpcH/HpaI aldolase/citrate lyase family protein [Albidovulum sediminicola]|uniref:CoA ester lyase n=1 Tax=Albidovulum sediminicola TaxID=2984331 RepID=A0ABT2YZ14_9RHOB|nr:CoA ester lyase [Defluviimonas sp. WL0075]MCV2864096.1 CoA ester lyase [Defluviimonas sp. WL0075]
MPPAVTYLFVPGDRPERFSKALSSGADRVILDLEDAVRPEAKATARAAILSADLDWARVVIRINDAASPFFAEDLALLGRSKAAAVLLPKAETASALGAVAAAAGRKVELLPQIETARGMAALAELLAADGVSRAVFGHLDFALDLGAAPEWEALLHARCELVYRSRLAGVLAPVDSVTTDVHDPDRAEADGAAARRLGFGGKLLIHPAQVAPVARAFAPSEAERAWAERVIAALSSGMPGAVALDGKMIDRPVEEAARRILARVPLTAA